VSANLLVCGLLYHASRISRQLVRAKNPVELSRVVRCDAYVCSNDKKKTGNREGTVSADTIQLIFAAGVLPWQRWRLAGLLCSKSQMRLVEEDTQSCIRAPFELIYR
jgi:hypothetical protein